MNICITGALGHIGSYLIRNLRISSLDKVYLVDDLSTQRYPSLFDLPRGINYRFFELDILSDELESVVKDSDVVVHLAAVTNAEASFYNVDVLNRVNKDGIEKVANLCAKYNCALIFPSSTSVYGSQEKVVDEYCKEDALNPQSPYAESKLYGEKILQKLGKDGRLKYTVFRLGTIFGYSVGMRFHTAVNKFIWQAALGKEITVWRTALNQRRPYCGLDDCVNAVNYVINEKIFDGEIYNIVTVNLTVQDIINVIKEYIPELKIKFVDSPIMNQLSYVASNRKSLERGFLYNAELTECIKETIAKLQNVNSLVKKQNLLYES